MTLPKLVQTPLPLASAVLGASLALAPGVAHAQQAAPQRYIDETEMSVRLLNVAGRSDAGAYHVRVAGTIFGGVGQADAIRVDVKQGNNTLASKRCDFGSNRSDDGTRGALDCDLDQADLTATGAVRVDLVYVDDQNDSAVIIRTLNLQVNRYWSWTGNGNNNRPNHRAEFAFAGDDLLGVAYAYQIPYDAGNPNLAGLVEIYFWTSSGRSGSRVREANVNVSSLRCSVNGQRLADVPLSAGGSTNGSYDLTNRVYLREAPQDDDVERWQWNQKLVYADHFNFFWGTRAQVAARYHTTVAELSPDVMVMGDHPGAWSCDLRTAGSVVRQFRFNVNADGTMQQHPELVGPGAPRVVPGTVMLDTRFPNPNDFDFSFQPAAIRASAPWGRPWAHPDTVRDMLSSLPPAVGTDLPSVVPAGTSGGGRRRR